MILADPLLAGVLWQYCFILNIMGWSSRSSPMRIPLQPQILAKTAEFLPGVVTLQRAAMSSLKPGKQL